MSDKYIVAHPGSLAILDTLAEADEKAHLFRDTQPVEIYRIVKVAHWMPKGAPPPAPTPVGDVEVRAA